MVVAANFWAHENDEVSKLSGGETEAKHLRVDGWLKNGSRPRFFHDHIDKRSGQWFFLLKGCGGKFWKTGAFFWFGKKDVESSLGVGLCDGFFWAGEWGEGMNRCENWQVHDNGFPVVSEFKIHFKQIKEIEILFIKKEIPDKFFFDMMSFQKPSMYLSILCDLCVFSCS